MRLTYWLSAEVAYSVFRFFVGGVAQEDVGGGEALGLVGARVAVHLY